MGQEPSSETEQQRGERGRPKMSRTLQGTLILGEARTSLNHRSVWPGSLVMDAFPHLGVVREIQ